MAIGGVAAVLLEFGDARIRSGVLDHSTYKVDPIARSRRIARAAMAGVFGPAPTARRVIADVNRVHQKVVGQTPAGEPYRALDPDLLDWVSATAGWGFLQAYSRFVAPLSELDRRAYYADGEVVARLYGVRHPVRCDADFHAMLARWLPRFEAHPITLEVLEIVMSGKAAPGVPRPLHRALGKAAVSLLPLEVRERLELGRGFDLSRGDRLLLGVAAKLVDVIPVWSSPPWQAARRLGLPGRFAWMSPEKRRRMLARVRAQQAASARGPG
jgi:uncharacterized protein (DUF2236 family)